MFGNEPRFFNFLRTGGRAIIYLHPRGEKTMHIKVLRVRVRKTVKRLVTSRCRWPEVCQKALTLSRPPKIALKP